MSHIIEVKNIGKKYRLEHSRQSYRTFRDVIVEALKKLFRSQQSVEDFWALKNINFSISKGEVIGIIGKNGAGKSTLLKLLTGIAKPTEGEVRIRGKVASLLEVGTGFHPELTGRENIFLNGVILGMRKKEIEMRFAEIVEFAGIEKFLDTPVKHYSSGMYTRLAFSVAAHLEPDILIVDEVLAVGDAEFQKKCLGKMREVSQKDGRTVIFVSHNLDVIHAICGRVLYLEDGMVIGDGEPGAIIESYIHSDTKSKKVAERLGKEITITEINFTQKNIPISSSFTIEMHFIVNKYVKGALACFVFYSGSTIIYSTSEGDIDGELREYEPGTYRSIVTIPASFFNVGTYRMHASLQKPGVCYMDDHPDNHFRIISKDNPRDALFGGKAYGFMATVLPFTTQRIK